MTESDLEAQFPLRSERFEEGDFELELLLPLSSEDLIDESDFNTDERLPYWAELWPAARALAREVLHMRDLPTRALEIGCGIGLPSLALLHRGVECIATDYYQDALVFARRNAERNRLAPLTTLLLDWRAPPVDLPPTPLVLAADVLYEPRNVEALLHLLPTIVTPGGTLLLSDPGRIHLSPFADGMQAAEWIMTPLPERLEPSPAGKGIQTRVRLLRFERPA